MSEVRKISQEEIEQFINGDDPMERIVNMEYKSSEDSITIFYRDEQDRKCVTKEAFYPFVWATRKACNRLCNGDRVELKRLLSYYHISVKKLSNTSIDGDIRHEFDEGYMFMFFATVPMSYNKFCSFFKKANNPLFSDKDDKNDRKGEQYLTATPVEQHMIRTGKRFFKGYNDYNDIVRLIFDLETTGLDTKKDRIVQLGVRLNRPIPGRPDGFEKIFTVEGETEEEKDRSELKVIDVFFRIIYTFRPDVISAHNGENFDWNMLIGACERLGTSIAEMSAKYFDGEPVRKEERESILKLGGEIEAFHRTIVPGTIITDSMHAVRRAQSVDSNMLRADLKYATEYSGIKKANRVYTPGDKISDIWADKEHQYAFCDEDGDWYVYDPESENGVRDRSEFASEQEYAEYIKSIKSKQGDSAFKMRTRNVLLDGYTIVTGRYIVERYLLDDIWECDKVEYKYNAADFSICKTLPLHFKKCVTMGTAGQWKALMMAWSYKKNLAIPPYKDTGSFTGGLSRLLKTGFVENVCKADYGALYPGILLTWHIHDSNDLLNSMLSFLEYFLTQRNVDKAKKKAAEKIVDKYKVGYQKGEVNEEEAETYKKAVKDASTYENLQLVKKRYCNSYFGALGCNVGAMFPWKSVRCGEQTTCTGRQCLRLLISHFVRLGYDPIVGDSVTGDTPLFIKYKDNGLIDIKPICEIIDDNRVEKDTFGREYDYSDKPYKVLCRSGWSDVEYVYRHETNKPIYRIQEGDMLVDVTEDHSLFDENKKEVKPTEITSSTKLEYYGGKIQSQKIAVPLNNVLKFGRELAKGKIDRVPLEILNSNDYVKKVFLETFKTDGGEIEGLSKTGKAGLLFLTNVSAM